MGGAVDWSAFLVIAGLAAKARLIHYSRRAHHIAHIGGRHGVGMRSRMHRQLILVVETIADRRRQIGLSVARMASSRLLALEVVCARMSEGSDLGEGSTGDEELDPGWCIVEGVIEGVIDTPRSAGRRR